MCSKRSREVHEEPEEQWYEVAQVVFPPASVLDDSPAPRVVVEKHRATCLIETAKRARERKQYAQKWPNYCRTCEGHGLVWSCENLAPHGGGHWGHWSQGPCVECYEVGICPRCGHQHSPEWVESSEAQPCEECGWQEQKSPGLPPLYECTCGEGQEDLLPPMEF